VTETTEAQRRGLLLLEGVQRIIDQLKNDPNLIEMTRILIYNPIESRGEPSVLELMCKVAREVVEGPRGPIVMIVDTIQCKVD
jgi:hypothetical protein